MTSPLFLVASNALADAASADAAIAVRVKEGIIKYYLASYQYERMDGRSLMRECGEPGTRCMEKERTRS